MATLGFYTAYCGAAPIKVSGSTVTNIYFAQDSLKYQRLFIGRWNNHTELLETYKHFFTETPIFIDSNVAISVVEIVAFIVVRLGGRHKRVAFIVVSPRLSAAHAQISNHL